MSSAARKRIKDFYSKLNRGLSLPPVPSESEKKVLLKLESLKVGNPLDTVYDAEGRKPEISGTIPEAIVVEVRRDNSLTALTYWYYWKWDRFRGDHEDWEPVTLVYTGKTLTKIFSRVHNGLVSFAPNSSLTRQMIFFYSIGHTPVLRVKSQQEDYHFYPVKDNRDQLRASPKNS